jgi:N utilization substance protein B
MSRKASREMAMKLLYQLDFHKEKRQEQFDVYLGEVSVEEKDMSYVKDIVDGVEKNLELIDSYIEQNSKGWKISRISRVNIAILRLAIYELTHRNDIPINVSINEAVELTKKYSTKDDSAFVNGLLGKIPSCEKSDLSKKGEE